MKSKIIVFSKIKISVKRKSVTEMTGFQNYLNERIILLMTCINKGE